MTTIASGKVKSYPFHAVLLNIIKIIEVCYLILKCLLSWQGSAAMLNDLQTKSPLTCPSRDNANLTFWSRNFTFKF